MAATYIHDQSTQSIQGDVGHSRDGFVASSRLLETLRNTSLMSGMKLPASLAHDLIIILQNCNESLLGRKSSLI